VAERVRKATAKSKSAKTPVLLSGGNPQIAKGYGDEPVQAYHWRCSAALRRVPTMRSVGWCAIHDRSDYDPSWAGPRSTMAVGRSLSSTRGGRGRHGPQRNQG
jgi:hypothetical protein